MLVFILIVLIKINSSIPDQFSSLVAQVMANSQAKIPKKDREAIKYHGNYSINNSDFTLIKNLTSKRTIDIKAIAFEKNYAAILKSKKFKIADGFVFFDHTTQKFFLMEKTVAFDDKINIYKAREIEMFHVFSNFVFKGKSPLLAIKEDFNWDTRTDRPKLIQNGKLSIGVGAFLSVSCQTKVHFISIKKAEIAADVTINGKVGAELKIMKIEHVTYQYMSIIEDINHDIKGLSTSFTFMGLKFEIETSLTFGAILQNLETELQADIDYYKGFQYTAKRHISIKCHGISDSGWQTDFFPIPTNNLVDGNTSYFNTSKLSSLIEINQGIRLKAIVANNIKFDLQFGLLQPFKIDFDYNPLVCPFPYLYGNSELQLKSYLHFSGIKINVNLFNKVSENILLNEIHKDAFQFHNLKTRKHCLFDSRNNKDHAIIEFDNDDLDDDQSSNESLSKAIALEINNVKNSKITSDSLISFQTSLIELNLSTNTQLQIYNRRASIYKNINNIKSNFDQIIVADYQNPFTSKVAFNFFYATGTNIVEKSNEFSFFLKDYSEEDEQYSKMTIYNPSKTEEISFGFRISSCEILPFNEMYKPSLRNGIIINNFQFGDKICVIVKDANSYMPDYVDERAKFTTDGTLSRDLSDEGIFSYEDEYFQVHLDSVTLPNKPESGSHVNYEVRAEWGKNYQENILLISNFTNNFTRGTNIIMDDYKTKIKINKNMRLRIIISYIYNFNVITLNQQITYSEILKAVESEEQTIVKTQSRSRISCLVTFQRYKPVILLNCTKKTSDHRIITNVYPLKTYHQSGYKKQVVKFRDNLMYGVFQIKRIHKNIKWVIIHMPFLQPLCEYTMISDEYYQIPITKDILYIPFRKENISINEVTINNVIQGNFVDSETVYFENKMYSVNFDESPIVLAFVRTIKNQYSITGIENTRQTIIDYGNEFFKILVLSYGLDKKIEIVPSLVIIDENIPFIEKIIPYFPKINSVIYHVWCKRADSIMIYDKTTRQTTENNIIKDGLFFKVKVKPDHIIYFMPVCKNRSQPMCYIKQRFSDNNGYAVFQYSNKNGITIFDPQHDDPSEQKDGQGLVEEIIPKNKEFYYILISDQHSKILRTYNDKIVLELRIIDHKNEKTEFCIVDHDGQKVPFSRIQYTDYFNNFINQLEIQNNAQYYDFTTGEQDSCIYAKYKPYKQNETNPIKSLPNPSTIICDIAQSFKVLYYPDIKQLVPPASFEQTIYSVKKIFEDYWANDADKLQYEINDYFIKIKKRITPEHNSIFCLYLPYDEILYSNTLNDDEYISAKQNIIIRFLKGTLNYILPEEFHTIIDIGDRNEIKLNLKGKGTLEIQSQNQEEIKILGQINLDSIKTILVNNNVKLVEIENLNIANYTELHVINKANQKVQLKIRNLNLLEHSRANLTDFEILEKIIIRQTATALVDSTVKFSQSELFIELKIYQNDLIPMISGILPDPPKKIHVQRSIENQGPKIDEEYIFFDGKFDCQLWLGKLDFGNSFFNTARCSQVNNTESNLQSFEAVGIFLSFVDIAFSLMDKTITSFLIAGIVLSIIDVILLIIIIIWCRRVHHLKISASQDPKDNGNKP